MNTKNVLLENAERDLAAAKSLFEKKFYPQAVFYLEQSVEKATKSFGLYFNIIKEDELKEKIRHDPLKIYDKVVEGLEGIVKDFQKLIKKFPRLKCTALLKKSEDFVYLEKLDKMVDEFKSYREHSDREISDKEMGEIIPKLIILETLQTKIENKEIKINKNEIEHDFQEVLNTLADDLAKKRPELGKNVKKKMKKYESLTPELVGELVSSITLPELGKNVKKKMKKYESLTQELMEELVPIITFIPICSNQLFFLSRILCPHTTSSRYPEDERNPLKVYTAEHPIIENFNTLTQITNGVLERMSKLFSEIDSEN